MDRGRRSWIVAVTAVVAIVVLAPRASAVSWQDGPPDGTRWQSGNVVVVTHILKGFARDLNAAVADWNTSDVVHLTVVKGSNDASTRSACSFVPGDVVLCMSRGASGDENDAGWTETQTDDAGYTTAVRIWVSASFVKNSSHNVRESLACHELGHAIGLVHRDGNSCMNADSWPVHPDSFDFDTLDALYAGTYGP
jgi:hypothetical protein